MAGQHNQLTSEPSFGNLARWPVMTDGDREAVDKVLSGSDMDYRSELESTWLQTFPGSRFCLSFSSGTAALHAALYASSVRPGNEVIMPALAPPASLSPVLALNAKPVFVDSDPATFNIATDLIEPLINDKTGAILVVHLHGLMVDMPEIRKIADKHGVPVVEDACHATGAHIGEFHAGSYGIAGCFSLSSTSNLSAGTGGVLVTSDFVVSERARSFREWGESIEDDFTMPYGRLYQMRGPGLNYRMPEICAALAMSRLDRFNHVVREASRNGYMLSGMLESMSHKVSTQFVPDEHKHVYHRFRIKLASSIGVERFAQNLTRQGVPISFWMTEPLPLHPIFHNSYNVADFLTAKFTLRRSVIVGNDNYPLFAQSLNTVQHWGRMILQELSQW